MAPAPRFAYRDLFEEQLPYCMALGMTPDEFWNGDVALVKAYRKAFSLRQDLDNQRAWLQGLYIYEAILDASPVLRAMGAKRPQPYAKEPYDIYTQGDKEKKRAIQDKADARAKTSMEAFAVAFNQQFHEKEVNSL